MNTLFATNTVKNCLYFASKVENEKSNTVNRRGILLRIILLRIIKFHFDQTSDDGALGFFQRASTPNNKNKKISSVWGPVPGPKRQDKTKIE